MCHHFLIEKWIGRAGKGTGYLQLCFICLLWKSCAAAEQQTVGNCPLPRVLLPVFSRALRRAVSEQEQGSRPYTWYKQEGGEETHEMLEYAQSCFIINGGSMDS